jgi:2-polyprenyl-6-methoxyphenol hydroxylase-like FAD-dependent oxidoreductase
VTVLPVSTDVLIVGAGPAGLTMAASLVQLGIECVVVDRKPDLAAGSKAAAVQPRTLEYLHRLGVAEPLIDDGIQGRGFTARDGDRVLLRASFDSLDSPYPYLLLIGQQQTEYRLEERLRALGGVVHRSVRMVAMVDDYPGTTVTVATADGSLRAIHARYVIGCDGVHSVVRQRAGIGFPGDAPEQVVAVADVEFDQWPPDDRDTTFFFSAHGLLLMSPLPKGQVRVVASVPGNTPEPSAHDFEQLISQRGSSSLAGLRLTRVVSAATYRVQQRIADRLSASNVFLAGDAAHTHSPAGGQGMNTGIQDAGNLAWKLHAVLSGRAAPRLLDTYAAERRPVAERLVAFTSQLMGLSMVSGRHQVELRNDAIAAVSQVPSAQEWLALQLSQLDVGYADRRSDDQLSAGHRMPPALCPIDNLNWAVVTPDDGRSAHPDGVTVIRSAKVSRDVFVRPDGYIAGDAMVSEVLHVGGSGAR